MTLLSLLLGLTLLLAGGVALVSGGSGLASRLGVSPLLVGLTDTLGGILLPALLLLFMDNAAAQATGSALASMLIYILMAGILLFKPSGLFGGQS